MARVRKQMTQEQFAAVVEQIGQNLGNIKPQMDKFAKRYQASMRKNARTGRNADGSPMDPLTPLTMKGKITLRHGGIGPPRANYGSKPLVATGEMVRNLKATGDASGWIAYVEDEYKRQVSFWQGNVPSGRPLRIKAKRSGGRAMARAMAAKGMPVSPQKALQGFVRQPRLPFALNSRQVKRSVTDLNKFVLKPLFG